MSGVTKEQIAEARAVDLLDYIQSHEPGVLKREGPGIYRHKEHDSLVYCRKYWYWNSRGKAINALDYLMVSGDMILWRLWRLWQVKIFGIFLLIQLPSVPSRNRRKRNLSSCPG